MTTPLRAGVVPIQVNIAMAGYLQVDTSDRFTEPLPPTPPALRATPIVVLTAAATPIIVRGVPTVPAYGFVAPVHLTVRVGPGHIYAEPDPNPVWDPDADNGLGGTGAWTKPVPASGVGDYRWAVHYMPNPDSYPDGTYPVGDPSTLDETDQNDPATYAWYPDPGTGGPAWHSAAPFKPEIVNRNVQLANGDTVQHPLALAFSSDHCAHMWLDMGAPTQQPFTWVVVAMLLRQTGALQTILDSGRNPFSVGMPQVTIADLGDGWTVADGLGYRQQISTSGPGTVLMDTSVSYNPSSGVGTNKAASPYVNDVSPRFYGCVFNGSQSLMYYRGYDALAVPTGKVFTGAGYLHQYYVLGRQYGLVSQDYGAEMLVFEMRFWHRALTRDELDEQYQQLSSVYKFKKYGVFP